MRKKLVRVSEINKDKTLLPFRATTLYRWHHEKRYPEIFVKFGGALFVDLEEFERLCEAGKGA